MVRGFWVIVAVLLATAVATAGYLQWSYNQPVGGSDGFTINSGDGVSSVSRNLVKAGIIEEPYPFVFWSYATGVTAALKAGDYRIEQGISLRRLLEKFVAGDVITHSITLLEGWTFGEFLDALAADPVLRKGIENRDPDEIMSELGHPELHPEGRFFPDTYIFDSGTTGLDILRRAFQQMRTVVDKAWQERSEESLLDDTDEVLIMASIIEKETGKAEERDIISAVFNNRLAKKMRLQTDPTVIYGLGDRFDGNLKRSHLREDTPYNTYTRHGLPPTPIANPGADSIRAALHPADTRALYFVSRGDGSHYFSETLEEHNQAVSRFQLGRTGQ